MPAMSYIILAGTHAAPAYARTLHIPMWNGATWSAVSTAGAQQLAQNTALPLFSPSQSAPACVSTVVDPSNSQSLYATFPATLQAGAPPLFFVAYETADGGQTWTPVPLPQGARMQDFGGFQLDGSAVQALFVSGAGTNDPTLSVEETSDAGATWDPSQLTCPVIGPCARWGQAPNGIGSCAMHEDDQSIDVSFDGGQTWAPPASPSGANACDSNELVSLSSTELALLSGRAGYPLQVSQDGGRTWAVTSLPELPALAGTADSPAYAGLQILPDGTLLAQGGQAWYLLPPGAGSWCTAAGAAQAMGLDPRVGTRMVHRFGDDWEDALGLIARDASLGEPIVHGLPVVKVEAELAGTREMALTEEDVKGYCAGKIAHFKVPRYIEFVEELPRTPSGKFDLRTIRCVFSAVETCWDREAARR